MILIDEAEVKARLDHASCIALMRPAMIALAEGKTRQLLRGIIDLDDRGNMFGVMPGAMDGASFGAKLISIFPASAAEGKSHQGAILLFDGATGAPSAVIDAGEVTAIRTACASAAATDALARPDAKRLAIFGTGEQAWQHALAIPHVRPVEDVIVWGRDPDKAAALAARIAGALAIPVRVAATPAEAAAQADILCLTTGAAEPILHSAEVADGTHINLVGSSRPGPVEIDDALVVRSRFVPDHREGVLAQGAEYLRAKAAGLVDESHVLPEIGHVFAGTAEGRRSPDEVTIYKSLGSIVQDLACADWLVRGR
jgi:ornithine cyclodeaminase/alanine dehydrogenase-like protein (mu-crystallin family)